MNKLYLIVVTVFLNLVLFSCTPNDEVSLDEYQTEATSGGEDDEILPPEDEDDGDNEDDGN